MIERARAEHPDDRSREDRRGERPPRAVRGDHEERPDDEGDEEGGLVEDSSEERPYEGILVFGVQNSGRATSMLRSFPDG